MEALLAAFAGPAVGFAVRRIDVVGFPALGWLTGTDVTTITVAAFRLLA